MEIISESENNMIEINRIVKLESMPESRIFNKPQKVCILLNSVLHSEFFLYMFSSLCMVLLRIEVLFYLLLFDGMIFLWSINLHFCYEYELLCQ